jgi:tetratricopeptide (TPR) repeat protein
MVLWTRALATWRELGETALEGEVLERMAQEHYFHRQWQPAADLYRQAAEAFARTGNPRWEAIARNGLGSSLLSLDPIEEAIEQHTLALRLARRAGDRPNQAVALHGLGQARRYQGDLQQALDCYGEALKLWPKDHSLRPTTLHQLGVLHGQPHRFAGTNGHVAAALMQALNNGVLKKGDVLLLEVQRGLLPAEVDAADFDAIRLASGLGVLVVEAAGNGGFNLDAWSDPATGRSLRRGDPRDSGAVLVGASRASVPHDRAHFSNYGSRLDCFGWGEAVTTCGYGDLYYGTADDDLFTNSFSGTSSASPIIAGAAALLQALHAKQTGFELEPRAMRALLSDPATGTREGPNVHGHIGVMPDLKAIVNGLQIVPVVYMRRSVRDDGSTPGPDDEISSSPDIFLCQGNLTRTIDHYGEGRRRENLPAPGDPMVTARLSDTANNHLYVRLRNRGLYEGGARIRLFASPAATLITPEHWIPWGLLDVVDPPGSTAGIIPQGDTLSCGPSSPD